VQFVWEERIAERFRAVDIGQLREETRELEDMQKGMKKVNPNVISMIDL
jgi:hypothetical protein